MLYLPALLCLLRLGVGAASPVAYPPAGPVRGLLRHHQGGHVSTSFRAIPYAKPPVGDLRFRRAQPHPIWEEVRDATVGGPWCLQNAEPLSLIWPQWLTEWFPKIPVSEDCLTLTIFYPGNFTERDEEESLAVMVYIHGGSFGVGGASGPLADGSMLATVGNVIVVAIQYRLGVMGFLATFDDTIPGNLGLFDQQYSLQWIQDNIRAFGGNPDAVTLFGQSAGSTSISYHMLNPDSDGLYHKTIGQSGATQLDAFLTTKEISDEITKILIEISGCAETTSEDSINCLRNISGLELLQKAEEVGLPFTPVGDGNFLPLNPHYKLKQGEFNKVPGIWGSVRFESDFILLIYDTTSLDRGLNSTEADLITYGFASRFKNPEPVFDALKTFYLSSGDEGDDLAVTDGLANLLSDGFFISPIGLMLEKLAEYDIDVFEYHMTHRPSFMEKFRYAPGAHHTDDMFFVLGVVMPGGALYYNATEEERKLSSTMMESWTSFAKTGQPVYLDSEEASRSWPKFDQEERKYIELCPNVNEENEKDNFKTENKYLWNYVIPEIDSFE